MELERTFTEDMAAAGYEVHDYSGRYFYRGPAVHTDLKNGVDLQAVIRATSVPVQWDNLGKYDFVVYPNQYQHNRGKW